MRKWLVTGGCGFIGTSLIKRLLRDDDNQICVLDNLSVGSRDDLAEILDFKDAESPATAFDRRSHGCCALVLGDILDEELAILLARQADVIVHLAANTGVGPSVEVPRDDCQTNIIGTFNYLEGARQAGG